MTGSASFDSTAFSREYVLDALARPEDYPDEVRQALAVLTRASRRETSSSFMPPRSTTSSFDGVLGPLVSLLNGVLEEIDDELPEVVDMPHFVPDGWDSFLNHGAITAPALEAPWLDELGHP